MNARELAQRLGDGKERQQGKSWWSLCPAHGDRHPSLKIDAAADRDNPLVCCMSQGCSQDAIITALKDRGLWAWDDGDRPPGVLGKTVH